MLDIDPLHQFPNINGVIASKLVADDENKVLFLFREKPTGDLDSGWRIFSGLEDQVYADNPENFGVYDMKTILKIDPYIEELLTKPRGSVFERTDADSPWIPVSDYPLEDDYLTIEQLTNEWSMEINNMFTKRIEEDWDTVFAVEDKTVKLSIWNEPNKNRKQLYLSHQDIINNRNQSKSPVLETFDFTDEFISRIGYMIEEDYGEKIYKVIYAFSIVEHQVVQLAFYFDNDEDQQWGIDTWLSVVKENLNE